MTVRDQFNGQVAVTAALRDFQIHGDFFGLKDQPIKRKALLVDGLQGNCAVYIYAGLADIQHCLNLFNFFDLGCGPAYYYMSLTKLRFPGFKTDCGW